MLKDLLVSEVRVKLLKILLTDTEASYHVRALVRMIGTEINAVRRELANLVEIGLLRKRQSSNKIFYTANPSNRYFPEFLSLVSKEVGIGALIINSAKDLGQIKYAVLSRAFSRGRESSALDVDLFIVGEVNMGVLDGLVKKSQEGLKKEINYTVMAEEEFLFRKRKNDNFISRVLAQSRTMLIGEEESFCQV